MCLIAIALDVHPRFALVVAANRDEFFDRPAESARWWRDRPGVFGGRDLKAGGAWMLVSRDGGFAAVTNVRRGLPGRTAPRSRGELPLLALEGRGDEIRASADAYEGFNLIAGRLGAAQGFWRFSNRDEAGLRPIEPGIHGLSNGRFDEPWPKVTGLKAAVRTALDEPPSDLEQRLLDALASREVAEDSELPSTGVGLERERMLAPAFISSALYGTRTSTVLSIERNGHVRLVERTWPHPELAHVARYSERRTEFALQAPASSGRRMPTCSMPTSR